jgi:hypothetical protein
MTAAFGFMQIGSAGTGIEAVRTLVGSGLEERFYSQRRFMESGQISWIASQQYHTG